MISKYQELKKDIHSPWRVEHKKQGLAFGITCNYAAFWHPEDESIWIRYMSVWNSTEIPQVIAKLFRDNTVWFHPFQTLEDKYKSTIEDKLLRILTHNKLHFNMSRSRTQRGIRLYEGSRTLIEACKGDILLKMYPQTKVISHAPASVRTIHDDLVAAYDDRVKMITEGLVVRAKLDILGKTEPSNYFYHWYSPDRVWEVMKKVNPKRLSSYEQLYGWVKSGKTSEEDWDKAAKKFFKARRQKVLEHLKAVTYT